MSKIIFKLNLLIFVSLFALACGSSSSKYSDLILTVDNNGQTIEIDIDNEIVIQLESNPSTGYHWIHTNADGSFIYQDGVSVLTEDPECNGTDGCAGVEKLTFRSSQTGSGVISLIYSRSSEEEPVEYFTINVNVH